MPSKKSTKNTKQAAAAPVTETVAPATVSVVVEQAAAPDAAAPKASRKGTFGRKQKVASDATNGASGAVESGVSDSVAGKKRRTKRSSGHLDSYIYKIHKQQEPNMKITKRTVRLIDGMLQKHFNRVINRSYDMAIGVGKHTLTGRDIRYANRQYLRGQLATFTDESVVEKTATFRRNSEKRLKERKAAADAAAVAAPAAVPVQA